LFREYLGGIKLKELTYEDVRSFRDKMLNRSTHQSTKISLTTVNRYMAYLRRILTIAERNDWITRNLFKRGDVLIHQADEVRRSRVLTVEESQRLIDCCIDKRSHIRPIVIAALDTGCRFNELVTLTFRQINFTEGIISILAENTKTFRARDIGITARLHTEFKLLWNKSDKNLDSRVFGVKDIRWAFKSACKEAEIENLRFHDLRRCHATRLDELGFSIATIGKQLGHSGDYKVTLRYISRDKNNIRKVTEALDNHNLFSFPSDSQIESDLIN
jgi:integrase